MGAKQEVLRFASSLDEGEMDWKVEESGSAKDGGMIDITPPELISGLITESGIMTCEGVAEELIKLWF